jgi:hypothetical protein
VAAIGKLAVISDTIYPVKPLNLVTPQSIQHYIPKTCVHKVPVVVVAVVVAAIAVVADAAA